MKKEARIFILDEGGTSGAVRFLADRVEARQLAEGKRTIVCTVTRTGDFYDPRYGNFSITREMLLSMVKNFEAGVYGQQIMLDVSHKPQDGSAGVFKRLFLDGNKLRADIELTPFGLDAIQQRGMIYLSAEFNENYVGNEEPRQAFGPTLLGAALTPRPVIKRLDPIQLSEAALDGAPRTLISDRITKILNEEKIVMNEFLKKLREALEGKKLAEAVITQLCDAFQKAAEPMATDELRRALMENFITTGESLAKQLAEAGAGATIQLSVGGPTGLDEAAVKRLLAEQRDAEAQRTRQLAETKAAKVKLFTDKVAGAEGLKSLSEAQRNKLISVSDMITAEMTDEQITRLAEHQIQLGNDMAIQAQLTGMGYHVGGSPRITLDESNKVKALQEHMDKRLNLTDGNSRRFDRTGGQLQSVNKELADKVLAEFDATHGRQLDREHKMLAGGDGSVSDVAVPASWVRTVIREALYNMVGLQFVDVGTAAFASSINIPYSYRDTTAAGRGNTRTYENSPINKSGVIQTYDIAYLIPQKLAIHVSDEMQLLTSNGVLDWNALQENQRNASRIIGEDADQLILNELLNASDEYLADAVVAEAIAAVDGAHKVFPLANFPVVHPRSVYDLKGVQIGNTTNPITVTYAAAQIAEFDGTGTQAAGTYYVMDYNNGMIQFVNQLGVSVTPPNGTAITVSYSYATNIAKFDTDLGADLVDIHWDGALRSFGLRKTEIEDARYHVANFGLMSGTAMTNLEQAKQFEANSKKAGSDLNADGSLGRVKDVPCSKGFGPGLNMGDQRIIIGEKGSTRFRMCKPWAMSELEEARDSNGAFTGGKEAWGSQYIALHTPTPLKRAYSSMVLYSTAARVVS